MSSETPYPRDPHAHYPSPAPAGGSPPGDHSQYAQQQYPPPQPQQYPPQQPPPVSVHSSVEYSTAQLVAFQFMADQGLLPQGIAPGYGTSAETSGSSGMPGSAPPGYPSLPQHGHGPPPHPGASAYAAPQGTPQHSSQYPPAQQQQSLPHPSQTPPPAPPPSQHYSANAPQAPQPQTPQPQPQPAFTGGPASHGQSAHAPWPMPPAQQMPADAPPPSGAGQRTAAESQAGPVPQVAPAAPRPANRQSQPEATPSAPAHVPGAQSGAAKPAAVTSPRRSNRPANASPAKSSDAEKPKSSTDGDSQDSSPSGAVDPRWKSISRGVALFLGLFSLLNLAGQLRYAGFDANIWWIDLRAVPAPAARGLLSLIAVLLICFAVRPQTGRFRWWLTFAALLTLLGISLTNTARYYELLRGGQIRGGTLLPYSLHIAACLSVVLAGVLSRGTPGTAHSSPGGTVRLMLLTVLICMFAFPLAQMMCFGPTDYRRPADAVVVFGCRVDANGRASDALTDRVNTACDLYEADLVKTLIFSGGPGEGGTTEPEAMKQLAVERGVPPEAIILDPAGLSTEATVAQSAKLFQTHGIRSALAVSHDYHLSRVKLCYRRAGIDVQTVPARETVQLKKRPWYMLREVAALWSYWLRPLT